MQLGNPDTTGEKQPFLLFTPTIETHTSLMDGKCVEKWGDMRWSLLLHHVLFTLYIQI